MKYRLPTLLLASAAVLAAAPAAHAATTIATEQRAATVSTYGDAIAWSSFGDGRYKLMLDQGGTIAAAAVPSARRAFDVDLGTSRSGALVAVYSRGGRIFEYDVAAGKERRLSPRGSDPTMMAGRLAYVVRRSGRDTLYLRSGRSTRVVARARVIREAQLSSDRLAFVTANGGTDVLHRVQTLRLRTLSGRSQAIYSARSGGANSADIVGPAFDAAGKHLYWARRNIGSGSGNRYIRYTVASGKTAFALGTDKVYSASWIGDADGFAAVLTGDDEDPSRPGGAVTVATTGALSFDARP